MSCTGYSWRDRQSRSRQAGSTSPLLQALLATSEALSFEQALRHGPPLSRSLLCTVICSPGYSVLRHTALPSLVRGLYLDYTQVQDTWPAHGRTQRGPGFAIRWQERSPPCIADYEQTKSLSLVQQALMDHKKVIKVNSEQLLSACALLKFHCCFSSPRRSLPAACINPSILGFTSLYKLLGWLRWLMRESPTKQSNTFIRLSSWSRAPVQACCWPRQPTLQKCLFSSWNSIPGTSRWR